MFQQCFNFNKIHDSVGKALRTANQDHVTANSHALSFSSDPCFKPHNMASAQPSCRVSLKLCAIVMSGENSHLSYIRYHRVNFPGGVYDLSSW